jgi:hypothetical protein
MLRALKSRGASMNSDKTIPHSNVVSFFAEEVRDGERDLASMQHANDNCCPYCGGALAPGDKASDCSSFEFRAQRMSPLAWRGLEERMM